MRLRAAAIAMLVVSSIGLVPGVAQATSATVEAVVAEAYQQWGDALGMRQECASGVSVTFEALPARRRRIPCRLPGSRNRPRRQ